MDEPELYHFPRYHVTIAVWPDDRITAKLSRSAPGLASPDTHTLRVFISHMLYSYPEYVAGLREKADWDALQEHYEQWLRQQI